MLSEGYWKTESVLRLGIMVLMSISGAMCLGYLAVRPMAQALNLDLQFVAQVIGFVSVQGLGLIWISIFLKEHGLNWAEAFGFRREPRRSVTIAGVTMLIALPVVLFVLGRAIVLLYELLGATPEKQVTVSFISNHPPGWQLAIMGFTAVVLAPVAEEALFRGILYTVFKQRGFRRLAVFGTSALFAFIHFNLAALLPLFCLALLWTWLYERTGNLLAPIAGHIIFNAVNFALLAANVPEWLEKTLNP